MLFSNQHRVESPFLAAGLDVLLWRLPENGWEYLILGTGEYLRYLPSQEVVDKEATALGQAQVKKSFGSGWKAAATAEYLYFDQVFDNSIFDREFSFLQVQGHTLTLRPSLRREFKSGAFIEIESFLTRQIFKEVVDDEWQAGPKLTLGRSYGNASEIAFGYLLTDRWFDTRQPRDADGALVSGKSLEFYQHELFAVWRHSWDKERRWRTVTRLSFQRSNDNDSGYYDYYRPRLSQQLRYVGKTWQVRADAKLTYYQYDSQPVSFDDPSRRRKTFIQATLRAEKNLFKSVKVFAEYEHERSISNLNFEAYRANIVSAGLDWEF